MTREEAIKILRIRKEYVTLIKENILQEALDMAIEALSKLPNDEWKYIEKDGNPKEMGTKTNYTSVFRAEQRWAVRNDTIG